MEERTYAKECGLRCSRLRMAQGMSQQELADKVFTTAQNISKYEKNGISNIDMIHRISDALGHDLLIDETDAEGAVGEIGREILWILIRKGGHISVDFIANNMYGMEKARINKEIFKLEHIGMCVREQYTGFDEKVHDHLFIRAKGIITYRNLVGRNVLNKEENEALDHVTSYETLLKGHSSYQDFVDMRPAEKLIRQLDCYESGGYRINYLVYLKQKFEEGFESDIEFKIDTPLNCIPGKGFYFDLIYRMAMHYDKDFYYSHFVDLYKIEEIDQLMYDLEKNESEYGLRGWLINTAEGWFENEFPDVITEEYRQYPYISKSLTEEEKNNLKELEEQSWEFEIHFYDQQEVFKRSFEEGHSSPYPTRWFSDEEIFDFIKENCLPARTDEEKKIDEVIRKINTLNPETLEYYSFPPSWETNGMAEYVRNLYGIKASNN